MGSNEKNNNNNNKAFNPERSYREKDVPLQLNSQMHIKEAY